MRALAENLIFSHELKIAGIKIIVTAMTWEILIFFIGGKIFAITFSMSSKASKISRLEVVSNTTRAEKVVAKSL